MRINDSSNKHISLYHDFLFWTKAVDDADTLADFIRNANFAMDAVLVALLSNDRSWQHDDWNNTSTLPISNLTLTSGQNDYGLADRHLSISSVRVKDRNGNYVRLERKDRVDMTDYELSRSGTPETYDKIGRSIIVNPTPDYTVADTGVELTFQQGSNYFTAADTTKEPGFDDPLHRYISLLPARDYCATNDMNNQYTVIERELQKLDLALVNYMKQRDGDKTYSFKVKRNPVNY